MKPSLETRTWDRCNSLGLTFLTDCTKVNGHFFTIWEKIFGFFSKHLKQIQD